MFVLLTKARLSRSLRVPVYYILFCDSLWQTGVRTLGTCSTSFGQQSCAACSLLRFASALAYEKPWVIKGESKASHDQGRPQIHGGYKQRKTVANESGKY